MKTPSKAKARFKDKAVCGRPQADAVPKQKDLLAQAYRLAEELCLSEGMELVHLEYQREAGGRILRVFIDKANGITLDDCVNISRQLSDLLDVHWKTDLAYHLEVSSPGAERPLGKLADFDRFRGRTARIRLKDPVDGQRNFKGILTGTTGDTIHLKVLSGIVDVHFQNIARARLVNDNGEKRCLFPT